MTHLLHECIAHQRSLDVRLDYLLSSCPDLNRGLLVLRHSSSPLLSLTHSDLSLLLSSPSSPPPPPSPIKSPLAFASSTSPSLERISPSLASTPHFTVRSPSTPLDDRSTSKTMTLSLHQEFVVRWGSRRDEPREIETCLEEILSLMHMGEDYTEFG